MRTVVIPADRFGCGSYRMIWPAQALIARGCDIGLKDPQARDVQLELVDGTVTGVKVEDGVDVVVLQRVTHPFLAQAVPLLRAKGVAVVVDVDDDLSAIHPRNPAFAAMHPAAAAEQRRQDPGNRRPKHSWQFLKQACADATLVTVSTPGLIPVYAPHGRARVLRNMLPGSFAKTERTDSPVIGWPAALESHPDDPAVVGGAVARLVSEGVQFRVVGPRVGVGAAFGLPADPPGAPAGGISLADWPTAVAEIGVGIAPLADTRFNRSKSWLKPLEMSAAGVPWVGSPLPEYERLHALGAGVLASRPRTWYRDLARLVNDEKARTDLSAQGREAVRELTIDQQAWRWEEAWSDALTIQHGAGRSS